MATKRGLERHLSAAKRFHDPRIDLEQYATPPDIAAHLVHFIDLQGDISDCVVCDLGTGPGILAIGAAFRGPRSVIGLELDPEAIDIARDNERRIDPPRAVEWIRGDATHPPIRPRNDMTVIMNPPFGAQRGNVHADRAFLESAAQIGRVSYSFHNAGSREFIESFASSNGGSVTAAMEVAFDLTHQFPFHEAEVTTIEAELYRICWDAT